MHATSYPALVLNADFRPLRTFPLSLLSWQETVTAVVSQRVAVVEHYDAFVSSPSTRIQLPSVVALRTFQRRARGVAFTRFNVFLRDRFACQYCGDRLPASALTFDHVVPRSRGGLASWTNVVTACRPCNTAKGNAIGIAPKRPARQPSPRELLAARRLLPSNHLHHSWIDYLYWDVELDA